MINNFHEHEEDTTEQDAREAYEQEQEKNRLRLEETRQAWLNQQEEHWLQMERGRNRDTWDTHWKREDRLRG